MSLQKIQQRLKAPKNQYNNFGKYQYRNQEDILEAAKPLLAEYEYILNICDAIELIGERYYIKAIAAIIDKDGKQVASSTAYAREPETKKGMDESQITGAASSYARKYALNGLLAIDDTKDADSDRKDGNGSQLKQDIPKLATKDQSDKIIQLGKDADVEMAKAEVGKMVAYFRAGEKLTYAEAEDLIINFAERQVQYFESFSNQGAA